MLPAGASANQKELSIVHAAFKKSFSVSHSKVLLLHQATVLTNSIKEGSKEDHTSDSRHLGLMGLEGTLCGSYDHVTLRDGGAHVGVGDPPAFQERLEVGQDAGVALAAQRAQHEAKTGRPSRRLHRAPPHRAHAGLVVALQRQHPPVRIVPTPQLTTGHSERREREKMIELTAF